MFGKSDRDDVSSDASPTQKKPRHAAAVASTRINTPSSAKTNKAPPSHKKPSTPASAPVPPVVNADSLKKLGRAAPKKIPLTPSSIFNHELLSGLMNSNGDEAKKEEAKRDEGKQKETSKANEREKGEKQAPASFAPSSSASANGAANKTPHADWLAVARDIQAKRLAAKSQHQQVRTFQIISCNISIDRHEQRRSSHVFVN